MNEARRKFVFTVGATGLATAAAPIAYASKVAGPSEGRRLKFAHVDVFTSEPLLGNPVDVFLDARGLSDAEMLAITRETFLNEATFVFPRDARTERERGVRVRIFTPRGEVPFAGHPSLGTATILRYLRQSKVSSDTSSADTILLDLNVGQVPVEFRKDSSALAFGEMRQVAPTFGAVHDRAIVAELINLSSDDIADDAPIQTVSTGLPFTIVPIKRLSTLQSLRINTEKMLAYSAEHKNAFGFYYITKDTGDTGVTLRSRCLFVGGEDAATGSAAGCTVAWMVRYGVAAPEQAVHIRQGVETHRTSDIYARAGRQGEDVVNVRVGGYAIRTMQGELLL